jgi:tRNA uridine 5-carbamoylmethylation protein Kti12
MPLVVLAGQPASGKSTAAAQLRALLELHGPVEVLDEPSLHLERNAAYSCELLPGLAGV